eukprot:4127595-Prorocentrum_lima.AAC.1
MTRKSCRNCQRHSEQSPVTWAPTQWYKPQPTPGAPRPIPWPTLAPAPWSGDRGKDCLLYTSPSPRDS